MTAPALIGPAAPTPAEFKQLCRDRDALARMIARDVSRDFVPDEIFTSAFRAVDGGVKTAVTLLKACR